ncbi:MAG TPA: ATP-dependent helicase, partial [Pyrinomonadaceae bacterium]|nr:ATP-dependent helicase [Pyrinomonadaceae bacterium]
TAHADKQFQAALHSWLKFHKAMLIGELIPESLRYLRLNPGSPYATAFDHILVDEHQDLNRAEQELIEFLASGSLVVIGDKDQSVYSFKHAHPEGIVEFPHTHARTEQAQLDNCRRCPTTIVEMANSLIANNATRSKRILLPFPGNPAGEVFSVQWLNIDQEAEGIAAFIKSRVDGKLVSAGSVLVLAPRREFGYLVRDHLRTLGVPAHSFFSEEILEGDPKDLSDCQAQAALSLLMLVANREDRVALRTWCGFGSNNLNANAWAKLREHSEKHGLTPWDVLESLSSGTLKIPYTKPLVERFNLLRSDLAGLETLKGQDLISAVFPADEEWSEPFLELKSVGGDDEVGAKELVGMIQRNVTQPELPTDVDYVRVMSLHKSKGLTADMVVVVGCLEGLMPFIDLEHSPSEQTRSLEEQRRLFYVAITRVRKTLVLSSVTMLPTKSAHRMRARLGRTRGQDSSTMTSRFVGQLGPKCPAVVMGSEFLRATAGK